MSERLLYTTLLPCVTCIGHAKYLHFVVTFKFPNSVRRSLWFVVKRNGKHNSIGFDSLTMNATDFWTHANAYDMHEWIVSLATVSQVKQTWSEYCFFFYFIRNIFPAYLVEFFSQLMQHQNIRINRISDK